MAHIVAQPCLKCKYTDCVTVCPVDCFHEGPNFLAIDPDECIDCTLCVAECPVNAIYAEEDVPADQQAFIALNAELSHRWPVIIQKKDPPADHAAWAEVKDKIYGKLLDDQFQVKFKEWVDKLREKAYVEIK